MTPRQLLNVFCVDQLHRVAQFGYARAVAFSLPQTSLHSQVASAFVRSGGEERSTSAAKQLHRSNRRYRTPEARQLKHESNLRYAARRKELKALRREQLALHYYGES